MAREARLKKNVQAWQRASRTSPHHIRPLPTHSSRNDEPQVTEHVTRIVVIFIAVAVDVLSSKQVVWAVYAQHERRGEMTFVQQKSDRMEIGSD